MHEDFLFGKVANWVSTPISVPFAFLAFRTLRVFWKYTFAILVVPDLPVVTSVQLVLPIDALKVFERECKSQTLVLFHPAAPTR